MTRPTYEELERALAIIAMCAALAAQGDGALPPENQAFMDGLSDEEFDHAADLAEAAIKAVVRK